MLKAGDKAPLFTLKDQNNHDVSLSDFLGKKVVLYFYPKDMTPGCTKQACSFRDLTQDLRALNVVILGVSMDDVNTHQQFIKKENLPFTLLSDPEKKAINQYDVWGEKNNYGKKYMGLIRSTFIIDENGIIIKTFYRASSSTNAEKVLKFLKES